MLEQLEDRVVPSVADLQVAESGPAAVTAGTAITYTITVTNNGPDSAQAVSLTDLVPSGTTFVSAAPVSGSNPDGFSYSQSGGTVTGTPTGGVVANGNTDKFTLVVQTLSSDPDGSTISNTATVTTTTTDDNDAINDETATVNSTVAAVADLSVGKSGPAVITAGTNATYTITLTNNGPSDAQNVSLTDMVPVGTSFISATPVSGSNPDGFSYSQSSGTVTGTPTGGVVANGNTDKFTLVVQALSSDADGSTISNTATVTTTTTDDNDAINDETATVNSTVAAVADLSIVKSGPAVVTAGTNVTYTITLTNNGPSDAQAVMTTDTPPPNTTLVSFTQDSGPPDGSALPSGISETFTLVLHLNANAADGSTITNTANVTTTTTDDSTADDETSALTSTVAAVADLNITKTGPATVTAGTDITYSITVTNNGPSDAQAVMTTDTPPPNTTLVSFTQDSGPPDGSALPSGISETFTLVLHLNANAADGSTISNRADVSTTTTDDSTADDETSTLTSNVVAVADLQVTKSGPAVITAGTDATYTITLTNNGPSDAQGVSLTDMVPAGTTFVSAAPVTGQNPDGFSYSESGNTVTGTPTAGVVANGSTDVFTLVVQTLSSDPDGSTISNTATVTTTTTDDNDAINDETATVNSTVAAVADLSIVKSGPAVVTAGANATYTITLTNNGPSDAQGVQLTDVVPTGTTFVSATPVSGSNPDGFSYTQSGGTVTGTPTGGVVANGSTDVFTLVVHALSSDAAGSTISNTANVTSTTTDDSSANDETSTATSNVVAVADLSVTKIGPATITAGRNATYTITLANNGPSDAQTVVLSDTLPTGATLVSLTPANGNPDTFTPGGSGDTVTETANAAVAAGHTNVFTLIVLASSSLPTGASFSDTASVTTSTTDDSTANDETSTVLGTITTAPDLIVTKAGPATVTEGDLVTYTLTVSNVGPSDAQGVTLTDTLPSNLTFVSATTSQGQFTQSGGIVTYSLGTVAAGQTVTATVVAQAGEDGTGTDTASVTSSTTDANPSNNTATLSTGVVEAPIVVTAHAIQATEFAALNGVTVATFTHANGQEPAGAFSAIIFWGDGASSLGTVIQSGTTYVVQGSHTYGSDANHTLSVTVVEDGVTASANAAAVVGERGLPAGVTNTSLFQFFNLTGGTSSIADVVNETLEHDFQQPPTASQINGLSFALFLVELGAAVDLIDSGANPLLAVGLGSAFTELEFAIVAAFQSNTQANLDTAVTDMDVLFLLQAASVLS